MIGDHQSQAVMRILWANRPGEPLADRLIPCFPSVEPNANRLNGSEISFLNEGLSPFYEKILEALSLVVATTVEADRESCRVILRESVVLITYTLVDRILRLNRVIAQRGQESISVATQRSGGLLPKTNAHLIGLVDGSQEFNQYLLFRLATSIWQLADSKLDMAPLADVRNVKPIRNLNFDQPGLLIRIKRKISRVLSAHLGRVPALRLANIDSALLDKGLYGVGKLIWLDTPSLSGAQERNFSLRERLLPLLSEEINETLRDHLFIERIGLDEVSAESAAFLFCELLLELIPPNRLEDIRDVSAYEQSLRAISAPALFFCSMPSDEEIRWIAAAKKMCIPVIGVQHGVHYGFSMQSCHIELEYAYCDKFITWGWTTLPKHKLCNGIELIPLPSPSLTERRKIWREIENLTDGARMSRAHDVLWMTDRLYNFPPTLSTLRVSRLDHLDEISRSMTEVVERLTVGGVRILHKPFNYTSADVQSHLLDSFQRSCHKNYEVFPNLDKGLTVELLTCCWIVIWDEPGTGFFECLLAGIPTMLLWDRLISHEEAYARDIFMELEKVGVIHTTAESLASGIDDFINLPSKWLSDECRQSAIAKVIDRFSSVNNKWDSFWKSMLTSIPTA